MLGCKNSMPQFGQFAGLPISESENCSSVPQYMQIIPSRIDALPGRILGGIRCPIVSTGDPPPLTAAS